MEIRHIDDAASPFHTNLNRTLDLVAESLRQALMVADCNAQDDSENTENHVVKECLSQVFCRSHQAPLSVMKFHSRNWQAEDSFQVVVGNLRAFLTSINVETAHLTTEAEQLARTIRQLETDKATLDEKGHELHCRIGYNALEKVLEETLYGMHSHPSLQSAECLKDEAEENLKRTVGLVRQARLRSCQLDTDIFTETKRIVQLFEEYDKGRRDYVKELDVLDDIKRCKLSTWLNESQGEDDQQNARSLLELSRLSERKRHLNAEVIQSALRMDSFNATLTFDRKANMVAMEKLTSKLEKVNVCTGVNDILPRAANAMTDLTNLESDSKEIDSDSEGEDTCVDTSDIKQQTGCVGYGLHKCPKMLHLASDPVTEPDVLAQLELALRWDQNDGTVAAESEKDSNAVAHKTIVTESHPAWQRDKRHEEASDVIEEYNEEERMKLETCKDDTLELEGHTVKDVQHSPTTTTTTRTRSRKSRAFQHHIESSNMLPDSAESQMACLVMKRPKDGRPVSSLTDVEKTNSPDVERESCSEA